jgi:hypothetical protein
MGEVVLAHPKQPPAIGSCRPACRPAGGLLASALAGLRRRAGASGWVRKVTASCRSELDAPRHEPTCSQSRQRHGFRSRKWPPPGSIRSTGQSTSDCYLGSDRGGHFTQLDPRSPFSPAYHGVPPRSQVVREPNGNEPPPTNSRLLEPGPHARQRSLDPPAGLWLRGGVLHTPEPTAGGKEAATPPPPRLSGPRPSRSISRRTHLGVSATRTPRRRPAARVTTAHQGAIRGSMLSGSGLI